MWSGIGERQGWFLAAAAPPPKFSSNTSVFCQKGGGGGVSGELISFPSSAVCTSSVLPKTRARKKRTTKHFKSRTTVLSTQAFPDEQKIIPFLRESFCSFRSGGINWLFTSSSSNFIFRQIKFAFSPPSLLPLFRKNKSPFPFLSNQSFLLFPPSLLHSECKFWGWRGGGREMKNSGFF